MRNWIAVMVCATCLGLSGCRGNDRPDAYGSVEATEVTVGAEGAGQLLEFTAAEGLQLAVGDKVGSIDSTALSLQRDQAEAQRASVASREDEVARQLPVLESQRSAADAQRRAAVAQLGVLNSQLEIARRGFARTERLLTQQAATSQQLDQDQRQVQTLEGQLRAQNAQIEAQTRQVDVYTGQVAAAKAQQSTATQQTAAAAAQVAEVNDRLRRTSVVNPSAGSVLVTYVERGEVVQVGQPLYKMADLSVVNVRAYISAAQLSSIRTGQVVRVSFDASNVLQSVDGTITWIASQAEFTPTPIQTREERADLVYAIKIRVPNSDHRLKIGMPVDVTFPSGR